MSQYAIEPAKAGDLHELLAFLLAAFRTNSPQHPPFEDLYPDLFAATDEAMGRHLVIREASRIVACVGTYPMDLRIGPCRLRVAGIGQVACAPDLRGGGRMSALLDATVARLPELGCPLSWLGGRHDRYARWGWELAGTALRCGMDVHSIGTPPAGWHAEAVSDPSALPDDLWPLRASQPVHEELPHAAWLTKLRRGQTAVWVARRDGSPESGAFAAIRQDGISLQEWGGAEEGLHAILAAAAGRYGAVSATFVPTLDPASALLWSRSTWVSGALSNLLVVDLPALWAAFAPVLQERVPPGVGAMLVMAGRDRELGHVTVGHGGERLVLDRLGMARLLFGPTAPSALLGLPPRLRWLDQVFPLPFRMPPSSQV